jgi:hypothetical protein
MKIFFSVFVQQISEIEAKMIYNEVIVINKKLVYDK